MTLSQNGKSVYRGKTGTAGVILPVKSKYVHTNLIARDWRKLAAFYESVFGCSLIPLERDLSGPHLEAATSIPGVRVRGAHLRLPGHGETGPTLEIFQYEPAGPELGFTIHRPGFGHLTFEVEDVDEARAVVLSAGVVLILTRAPALCCTVGPL